MAQEQEDTNLWILWAKWRVQDGISSYHPLLCHMIDVACVVEHLWDATLPQRWKIHLAEQLAMEPHLMQQWLMWLAGVHDIGKASPGFQRQLAGRAGVVAQQLLEAGGFKSQQQPRWVPHALVSAITIQEHYTKSLPDLDNDIITAITMMIGGHHGIFPSAKLLRNPPCSDADMGRKGIWQKTRMQMIDRFCSILDISPMLAPARLPPSAAMRIAGIISVADWIASSALDFPLQVADATQPQSIDAPAYLAHARQHAHAALQRMGWLGWHTPDDPANFTHLFPKYSPRNLQQVIIDIAPRLTAPTLVVIEAPMGEGKTEAALYLADRWCVADGGRGLFFALPTQATSTSMFKRVRDFLAQRFPADVVTLNLLHGHAALSEDLQDMQRQGYHLLQAASVYDDQDGQVSSDDGVSPGAVIATEWFASSKRALLASFGVGTIDQGLMAALAVKHGFVRHLGLSTKTVIIDEVHSYDLYMTTLMKRLIEWLGAHQVPVVLLSATLPKQRRQELLEAYARGAQWTQPDDDSLIAPYPRVSWVTASGINERAITPPAHSTVHLTHRERAQPTQPDADVQDAATLEPKLREALREGGCIAVICNTVNRAQTISHALQTAFADDPETTVALFHARFPYEQRADIEQQILQQFGKDGPRPKRAILVATQVIEQSLDLDFDLMVTDLAPIDLILQRLGRLHRHKRQHPQPLGKPTCYLFMPPVRDDCPAFTQADRYIYDSHILLRTWLLLRERDHLDLPTDIETGVEEIYRSQAVPADLPASLQQFWHATEAKMRHDHDCEEKWARERYIHDPHAQASLNAIIGTALVEDRPEIHPARQALTRNAAPSVTVICLSGTREAPHLRPNGPPIDLNQIPDLAATRDILLRSVTLSQHDVVEHLMLTPPPSPWQKVALLRHCRPLFFNAAGIAQVGRRTLHLDSDLGIVVMPLHSPKTDVDSADSE